MRIGFEQGGNPAFTPGTPEPNFTAEFPSWPIPSATAATWYLDDGGALASSAPAADSESKYIADPSVLPATFYPGGQSSDIWKAGTQYDWQPIPDENGVGFITQPLADDLVVAGAGSVELWISATSADTDLEATISEVRPDGQEIYVQSGWLRASERKLADDATGVASHAHQSRSRRCRPSGG